MLREMNFVLCKLILRLVAASKLSRITRRVEWALGEAIARIRVSSMYWGTWQGRDNEVENIIKGANTYNHLREDVSDDIEHEGGDGHAWFHSKIHVVLNINGS
jgi:hypothetical protein